ncbi:MAG: SHOCT domain-containing protein, partial [Candidatus Methanofastidiosia archaeon]
MKKIIALLAVLLVLSMIPASTAEEPIKVLIDESRKFEYDKDYQENLIENWGWAEDTDFSFSFKNNDEYWGYGNLRKKLEEIASVDIRESGKLSYNTLKDYDVLIIASFTESYSSKEAEAIKKFVENGGSLLLLADSEYPNNSISRTFDVQFTSETVFIGDYTYGPNEGQRFNISETVYLRVPKMYYLSVQDIRDHPVTKGIDEIYMYFGIPIANFKKGTVLVRTSNTTWADLNNDTVTEKDDDEDEGPFDIMVALEDYSKGRAIFFGGALSFWNMITEREEQNIDILVNAVKWLGEPGGPYKQYKIANEQAQSTLSSAQSLFDNHEFSQAKNTFEEAITDFEESYEIYQNSESQDGIEEAQTYIEQCETGIEADLIFSEAQTFYDNREYTKAIEKFEEAKSLYTEIGYTERVTECTDTIQKSNDWIALREKATRLFNEGESALETAPSTFDPSGYEEAKSLFEQAKSTWQEYDNPEKVTASEEKIQLCNQEIDKIKQTRMMVMVGAVVVVVIIVVLVVVIIRRRKPKEEYVPAKPEAEAGVGADAEEPEDPMEALKERYAKGEITKEEYEKLKSV